MTIPAITLLIMQEDEEWRPFLGTSYECSKGGLVRRVGAPCPCKVEASPREADPHVYVRLAIPGGKQRRVGIRNVVAECWLGGEEGSQLQLDGQGRVVQEGPRVVHVDGDPRNNAVANLRVVDGKEARSARRRARAAEQGGEQQQQQQQQQQQPQQQPPAPPPPPPVLAQPRHPAGGSGTTLGRTPTSHMQRDRAAPAGMQLRWVAGFDGDGMQRRG